MVLSLSLFLSLSLSLSLSLPVTEHELYMYSKLDSYDEKKMAVSRATATRACSEIDVSDVGGVY